jgi:uncharacterized membrane protein
MTQLAINEAEWGKPRNWHGGALGLYYSRRDSRAFVPRRCGVGATVNFARGAGVGFLLGVFAFVALVLVLARKH